MYEDQGYKYPENHTLNPLVGMLTGGLVGALVMLLLAPQSGKETRKQIQEKGIELRDRMTEMVDDTMAKIGTNANKITRGLKDQA